MWLVSWRRRRLWRLSRVVVTDRRRPQGEAVAARPAAAVADQVGFGGGAEFRLRIFLSFERCAEK
jgi:hypothetical protein